MKTSQSSKNVPDKKPAMLSDLIRQKNQHVGHQSEEDIARENIFKRAENSIKQSRIIEHSLVKSRRGGSTALENFKNLKSSLIDPSEDREQLDSARYTLERESSRNIQPAFKKNKPQIPRIPLSGLKKPSVHTATKNLNSDLNHAHHSRSSKDENTGRESLMRESYLANL